MKYRLRQHAIGTITLLVLLFSGFATIGAQTESIPEIDSRPEPSAGSGEPSDEASRVTIGAASMCEAVKNGIPRNEAIVFSISLGRVYCFTDFLAVPQRTFIYHHWFFEDQKRASIKLLLRPPRWTTYSSLQLRSTDLGPWRVDIATEDGQVLRTLRFSILE